MNIYPTLHPSQIPTNPTAPIRILTGTAIQDFLRIAGFINSSMEKPDRAIGQQDLADRANCKRSPSSGNVSSSHLQHPLNRLGRQAPLA